MKIQMVGGTVMGRKHHESWTNTQDGVDVAQDHRIQVACCTDGCGSGKHTEAIAARLARMVAHYGFLYFNHGGKIEDFKFELYNTVINYLAEQLHCEALPLEKFKPKQHELMGYLQNFAWLYLRCTVYVLVIVDDDAHVFYMGDGKYMVDGQITEIEQDNDPVYPAYGLSIFNNKMHQRALEMGFTHVPLGKRWDRLAISTDGVNDDILRHSYFWDNLEDPEIINSKLKIYMEDLPPNDRKSLRDDATMVLVKRTGEPPQQFLAVSNVANVVTMKSTLATVNAPEKAEMVDMPEDAVSEDTKFTSEVS